MKGIYCIKNKINNKIYLGSSKNINKRWERHKKDLIKGNHHNIHMQRAFIKYGDDVFEYSIVEEVSETNDLFSKEQWWIDNLDPEYNIGGVCGGDTFTNNPDKERIRELHRCNFKKLREEGRVPKTGSGDKNPNWRGGVETHDTCICGNIKRVSSSHCLPCSLLLRTGEENPFYGKHHSDATKDKVRKARLKSKYERERKGIPEPCSKKVMCDGNTYPSCRIAAEALNVSVSTISWRVRNKKDKWKNYYYFNRE